MARECNSCGVPLDGMDSADGVCADCYKREEGKSISALTSRSNEMNIWHPAKNEAEALAWFRTTAIFQPGYGVADMLKAGWTIPALMARGYIDLKPGAPEHLRALPIPPAPPSPAGGFRLTKKAFELGAGSINGLVHSGWTHEAMINQAMIEPIPVLPPPPAPVNEWHMTRPIAPSNITAEVVRQVLDRDAHGQRKYGVSMDRTDLSLSDWLQHMAEELMDGAHYALAAKRVRDQFEVEVRQLVANAGLSVRNPYTGGSADREIAFSQGMEALRLAIDAELSK